MTPSGNLIVALTLASGAAVAAVLAARHRERRAQAAMHEKDLQRWDDECGSPAPGTAVKLLDRVE
jgi:hypothetical protein